MISFYRKIRQKFLRENRLGRYLLYAVGEIFLVMVGILLALQVNNWNESRKQRAEEIATLKNVKEDFVNSIEEFEINNSFRERIISATKVLYGLINNHQVDYTRQELDSLMSDLFINPTYNGQSETLNILFNSGKINIISNDSIKNALVLWPQQVSDITEDEIYASHINFNELQPLVKRYVSLRKIYEKLNYKDLPLIEGVISSPFTADYKALFSDRNFEGTLAARELTLSVAYIQTRELVKTGRDIIRLINEEINNQ